VTDATSSRGHRASELSALDLISDPIWVFDLEALTSFWANRAALELFRADSLEALRERQSRERPSEGVLRRLDGYREHFARSETVVEDWTFYPEGGEPVHARCTCTGIRVVDERGEREGMLVHARPSGEALGPNERRLVEALRHTNELISMYAEDGTRLLCNPAAIESFGLQGGDGGDEFASRFTDPETAQRIRRCLATDEAFRGEVEVVTLAGSGWFDTEVRRVHDPVSGERMLLCVQRDVSSRHEFEARLESARDEAETLRVEAEAASQAKTSFLAVMSHELRTPMTGVLAAAELLRDSDLDADQREALDMVGEGGRQMLALIDDVLDISRIESGHVDLDLGPVPLRALVEETLRPLAPRATAKGLSLEHRVAEDVPTHVVSDRRRLAQILTNLVANAIKFTDEGGVRVHLDLERRDGSRAWIRLSVVDSGVGMEPAQIDALFEPFAQAPSTVRRALGGAGLGLHIARSLAELLGGDIQATGKLGSGSRFAVRIPGTVVERAPPPTPAPGLRVPLLLKVLVVDDNPLNRRTFARLLRHWGCEVILAEDGVEAVERVQELLPDVVLMDVMMPRLDGPSAAAAIRGLDGRAASTPIFAVTADAYFAHAAATGGLFDASMSKPIDWDALHDRLRALGSRSDG